MNIAEFFVSKLKEERVRYVFGLNGSGTAVQMMDALGRADGIDYVCTLHEQSAGMAADSYAAISGGIGACVATCGPGATNIYTAVAGSYYNSTPVVYIVGQPQLAQYKCSENLRHFGYHELDVTKAFKPITKYAVEIKNAEHARYEIEKSLFIAKQGRPGPVLIAIPDDVTWLEINPDTQRSFSCIDDGYPVDDSEFVKLIARFSCAERPLLMLGKGVKCANAVNEARLLADEMDCPVALTWAAKDIFGGYDQRNTGSFGVQGTRSGNFAVQNADFVLAIGVRFDASETGFPPERFASRAYLISVDIDEAELKKYHEYGIHVDQKIKSDARDFIKGLLLKIRGSDYGLLSKEKEKRSRWINRINEWKDRYPLVMPGYYHESTVNPYVVVDCISRNSGKAGVIITDTSTSRNFIFQSFNVNKNQRVHTWTNFACLGYGLPAAIGASYAGKGMVIAVMGDGALQFNIQELATVVFNRLNIKIMVFDNDGYANILRLQNKNLEGRHFGSDRENGLPLPDSAKIAKAYGLPVYEIKKNSEVEPVIKEVFNVPGPVFCSIHLDINHWTVPFRNGRDPLEDMTPKLPREELECIMSLSV